MSDIEDKSELSQTNCSQRGHSDQLARRRTRRTYRSTLRDIWYTACVLETQEAGGKRVTNSRTRTHHVTKRSFIFQAPGGDQAPVFEEGRSGPLHASGSKERERSVVLASMTNFYHVHELGKFVSETQNVRVHVNVCRRLIRSHGQRKGRHLCHTHISALPIGTQRRPIICWNNCHQPHADSDRQYFRTNPT